ncbi:hypothetical protein NL676_011935 [Syzygium grande]|nr:hypothetical protein NL676_011935 [Syzygium grande]
MARSLHWVVENGQIDTCKELLRKPNLHKDTVPHYAVRGGHDLVVKLLIDTANLENVDSSKRSIVDLQLVVAVLIVTVTFAAVFTMPGGYYNDGPDQGVAILPGRQAFKAFVISNTTAFCFSIMALFLQYDPSFWGACQQARYTAAAGCYIYFAICGLAIAFACGTYVVLTRTIELGIILFVVLGCLLTMHRICVFLDPEVGFWLPRSSPRRYVQNLLFDYGIL